MIAPPSERDPGGAIAERGRCHARGGMLPPPRMRCPQAAAAAAAATEPKPAVTRPPRRRQTASLPSANAAAATDAAEPGNGANDTTNAVADAGRIRPAAAAAAEQLE